MAYPLRSHGGSKPLSKRGRHGLPGTQVSRADHASIWTTGAGGVLGLTGGPGFTQKFFAAPTSAQFEDDWVRWLFAANHLELILKFGEGTAATWGWAAVPLKKAAGQPPQHDGRRHRARAPPGRNGGAGRRSRERMLGSKSITEFRLWFWHAKGRPPERGGSSAVENPLRRVERGTLRCGGNNGKPPATAGGPCGGILVDWISSDPEEPSPQSPRRVITGIGARS